MLGLFYMEEKKEETKEKEYKFTVKCKLEDLKKVWLNKGEYQEYEST